MRSTELADEVYQNPIAQQGVKAASIPAPAAEPDEEVWLNGRLSNQTRYRILIRGEMGPKEVGKLIKMLEVQKAVLSDDDPDGFGN